jgi:hypothetical protein
MILRNYRYSIYRRIVSFSSLQEHKRSCYSWFPTIKDNGNPSTSIFGTPISSDGILGLSKKNTSLPRGMLEPWIMANNPWKKKIALFCTKTIQEQLISHCTQMEADNI